MKADFFPELLIAGCPKCGTSSIHRWLSAHPDVASSIRKEPFFLMDRGNPLRENECNVWDHGLGAYEALFDERASEVKVRFDGTTHLIYQTQVLDLISALPRMPKVLVVMRDPALRLRSSFEYTRNNLARIDSSLHFSEFADLILNGASEEDLAHWITDPCSRFVLARDLSYGCYASWLSRWIAAVGREQVKGVFFEELVNQPQKVVTEICEWLEIDSSLYENFRFSSANETQKVKNIGFQRAAVRANQWIGRLPGKRILKGWYRHLNKAPAPTSGANSKKEEAAMKQLTEYYQPYNRQLAELLCYPNRLWDDWMRP